LHPANGYLSGGSGGSGGTGGSGTGTVTGSGGTGGTATGGGGRFGVGSTTGGGGATGTAGWLDGAVCCSGAGSDPDGPPVGRDTTLVRAATTRRFAGWFVRARR
jgi:hypothetical protein